MTVASRIREKLVLQLEPQHLEVYDESGNHNVPVGSESHFRVVVISERFTGQTRLHRHRSVNAALRDELAGPVHALAIDALTPEEWSLRGEQAGTSPDCLGGDGSLPRR